LGGLAEFEQELIRRRTGEGRERAKARGVILGRMPKLTSHQRREANARRRLKRWLTDIARSYNVSLSAKAVTLNQRLISIVPPITSGHGP
jgi:DNA invertase Pin-like site-specific DNA recombinase